MGVCRALLVLASKEYIMNAQQTAPTTSNTIIDPNLKPGAIWSALYWRDERGVRGRERQDILILSLPQPLSSGQMSVTVVPVLYEADDLMQTDLYAVDIEMINGYRVGRPVVFEFHLIQSVLVSDLHRYRWSLEDKWKPLLAAYWKAVSGLGDFPRKEEFPDLYWQTGVPVMTDEEGEVYEPTKSIDLWYRLLPNISMQWLASRFHEALHSDDK
jgi:hypothetical protein